MVGVKIREGFFLYPKVGFPYITRVTNFIDQYIDLIPRDDTEG